MLLLGTGGGLLFMPLILTATSSAARGQEGLASGPVSTSQQLGGALGLALLATLAGPGIAGFHRAFGVAGVLAALAAVAGAVLLPDAGRST